MPDEGWKDLQKLVHIGEEYRTLLDDLENNGADFKKWYD